MTIFGMVPIVGSHEAYVGGSKQTQEKEADSSTDPQDLPRTVK